ncbi:MAG: cation diffusion facilitator family transporter [Gammaproteobacteria bacterium]|nr:cation diffusion facilitator family transporter [Gammaproteobacteria bacterium]MCW8840038.1 cation diffusion facilitator family transporter [Gammaproteobacteria bacterium]MCW8971961.1 cation diffusion facilitator family transporter [Gammaproteobacteria bacterium]MCW8991999.1 cation diffusion facilitator family transporter [Gammaproteobacteria bacterium]
MGGHPHYHPEPDVIDQGDRRYREMRKVTLIGSVLDLALAVLKLIFGFLANSQALIADGVHSLSDLATDFMVLFAAKHGSRDADETHPYGHGRFETLATVALGIALIIVAAGIAWDAVDRLFHPEELLRPGIWALVVAVVSVLSKEWIYHYTMRVAKKLKSNMLRANAWHSRTDAISSIVVVIGVGGTMAGLEYLDSIAAVLVGAMVAKIGWDLAWTSVHELVDTALEPDRVALIRKEILGVGGVRELHMLRTRLMGGEALVDVHVIVDPKLSVSEGHYIGEKVRKRLIDEIDEVTDVMVHVDPEDDEKMKPSLGLPTRSWIRLRLEESWADLPLAQKIERIVLHYLDGRLDVEVCFPLEAKPSNEEEQAQLQRMREKAERLETVREVSFFYRNAP